MNKNSPTLESAREEIETISHDLINIIGCLETLENSIYFSAERQDKDMTKPNAVAAETILKMVNDCLDAITEVYDDLGDIAERKEA